MPFNHVREVIEASRKLGHVKNPLPRIWNLKIGALMESLLQSAFAAPDFRSMPDHAPNFRVISSIISDLASVDLKDDSVIPFRCSLPSVRSTACAKDPVTQFVSRGESFGSLRKLPRRFKGLRKFQ